MLAKLMTLQYNEYMVLMIVFCEVLVFDGRFGPFKVGEATLTSEGPSVFRGESIFVITSIEKTKGLFSYFYKVNDKYVSFARSSDLTPLRFFTHIEEGKFKKEITVDYYDDSIVYSDHRRYDTDKRYRDILSALYYIRRLNIKVGDTLRIPVHTGGKPNIMEVPVVNTLEISVPAGRFKTYVLKPIVKGEKIFGEEGGLFIYLSDDKERVPVMIKSKLYFGSINFVLKERKGERGRL